MNIYIVLSDFKQNVNTSTYKHTMNQTLVMRLLDFLSPLYFCEFFYPLKMTNFRPSGNL